jgi:hypothetical protein
MPLAESAILQPRSPERYSACSTGCSGGCTRAGPARRYPLDPDWLRADSDVAGGAPRPSQDDAFVRFRPIAEPDGEGAIGARCTVAGSSPSTTSS